MGIFGNIMDKIFHHGAAAAPAAPATPAAAAPAPAQPDAPTAPAVPAQAVDVGAVLTEMASMKGGGGSPSGKLADAIELDVHVGADGSAEENIALHKAVMAKLAENGGVVPDSLRN